MITPPVFDAIAAWGIAGLAVCAAVLWVWTWTAHRPAARAPLAAGVGAIMAISALAAWSGVLRRFDLLPPPMALMIVSIFAVAFSLGLSPFGRSVARSTPLSALIGTQAFRLPLELVMHRAAILGIMPVHLSYSGYNFDIATGAGAWLLWLAMRAGRHPPRWSVWLWNLWGIWSLVVIALVAVTTSPMVRLFGDDPRELNTWVLFFPYVWLPAVMVTFAVASHVVITRRLLVGAAGAPHRPSRT